MGFTTWDMFTLLGGLFIMIGVGYGVVKMGMIPQEATGIFSKFLVKISMPCTVFLSMNRPFDAQFLSDGLILMVLACVMVVIYTALSMGITHLVGVPKSQRGPWKLCCVFCNAGFVGFPIALAVFGEEGLALLALMNMPLTVLFYSLGDYFAQEGVASERKTMADYIRVFCSEVNFCVVLGLVFYFQEWTLPPLLLSPVTHLGNMTTPLSMIVVGMTLAGCEVGSILKDKTVISATMARLVIFPGVTYAIVSLIPWANPLLPALAVVILSCPSPGISPTLVASHGGDGQAAAKIVFLTSMCSVFTMSIWLSLL